jgi:hypothetical protein
LLQASYEQNNGGVARWQIYSFYENTLSFELSGTTGVSPLDMQATCSAMVICWKHATITPFTEN